MIWLVHTATAARAVGGDGSCSSVRAGYGGRLCTTVDPAETTANQWRDGRGLDLLVGCDSNTRYAGILKGKSARYPLNGTASGSPWSAAWGDRWCRTVSDSTGFTPNGTFLEYGASSINDSVLDVDRFVQMPWPSQRCTPPAPQKLPKWPPLQFAQSRQKVNHNLYLSARGEVQHLGAALRVPLSSCAAAVRCPTGYILAQFWQGAAFHPPLEVSVGAIQPSNRSFTLDFRGRNDSTAEVMPAPLIGSVTLSCGAWHQLVVAAALAPATWHGVRGGAPAPIRVWHSAADAALDQDADLLLRRDMSLGFDPAGGADEQLQSLTGIYRDALNPRFRVHYDAVKVAGSFADSRPTTHCPAMR
jgi:hypothetical protein